MKNRLSNYIEKKNISLPIFMLVIGLIVLVVLLFASIRLGATDLNFKTIWEAIIHTDDDNPEHIIIMSLRFPRAIAAILIGAALAVSGAIMQGMTRNPLGEPSILGVTAGAAFFVVLSLAFIPDGSMWVTMIASFIGAGMGVALVFVLTTVSKGGMTPVKLALAGSAITAFLTALTTGIGMKFDVSRSLSFWYAGGLSTLQDEQLKYLVPVIIIGLIIAVLLSRSISVMSLGQDVAKGLGQNTIVIQIVGTVAVLLLTGAAVSVAGTIGFIGLVIPHIVRFIVGVDYRWIIPISAVFGGILLVVADIVARTINSPFETPVGAVTALVGVPFFLYLARKEGRGF